MTPTDLVTYARQRYNAVTDTFFSDSELYTLIWDAQVQLARETYCIRRVYSTSTVIGQQEYQKPTAAMSIKRITYNGQKIFKITDREDDALTMFNQATTATGAPQYYWEWDTAIELRPVPDGALTLKIYTYDLPQIVSSTTTLDVPTRYHLDLADYLLMNMCNKEKNFQAGSQYGQSWAKKLSDAKRYEKKFLRGDSFNHVLDEETMPVTIIGAF
jgi:hypothetical protein